MAEVRNDALTLPHTGMRFRRLKDSAEIRVRREIVRVAGVCGVRTLGTSPRIVEFEEYGVARP